MYSTEREFIAISEWIDLMDESSDFMAEDEDDYEDADINHSPIVVDLKHVCAYSPYEHEEYGACTMAYLFSGPVLLAISFEAFRKLKNDVMAAADKAAFMRFN